MLVVTNVCINPNAYWSILTSNGWILYPLFIWRVITIVYEQNKSITSLTIQNFREICLHTNNWLYGKLNFFNLRTNIKTQQFAIWEDRSLKSFDCEDYGKHLLVYEWRTFTNIFWEKQTNYFLFHRKQALFL